MIHLDTRQAIERVCSALSIRYFDEASASVYGGILAALQRSGRAIATMDLLIAAGTLVDQAPLLTRNLDHFQRIPGLKVLTY